MEPLYSAVHPMKYLEINVMWYKYGPSIYMYTSQFSADTCEK